MTYTEEELPGVLARIKSRHEMAGGCAGRPAGLVGPEHDL